MFIVTLAFGVAVVSAIALSPLYVRQLHLVGSRNLGLAFVLAAVGLALVCVSNPGHRDEAFLCAFVLMLVGALLLYGDGGDDREDWSDDEPPWWPQFESDFRRYAALRRPSLPRR